MDKPYVAGLFELKAQLAERDERWIICIEGPGGVGKSSFAFQIARWTASGRRNHRLAPFPILPVLLESLAPGTFGFASYTVGKRLRELSIRVALGAHGKQISLGCTRPDVDPSCQRLGRRDPAWFRRQPGALSDCLQGFIPGHGVLGAVAFTVLLTGSLSVAGPVRRALLVDPAQLLR